MTDRPLITLAEHDAARTAWWARWGDAHRLRLKCKSEDEAAGRTPPRMIQGAPQEPNPFHELTGIECPRCSRELYETRSVQDRRNPPRFEIECLACEWRGWRIS